MSNKKEIAENYFKKHIADYAEREQLKYGEKATEKSKIYAYWCRSVEGSNFDLRHPSLQEYKKHFMKGDVDWLEKGKTYVNIRRYIKFKRTTK